MTSGIFSIDDSGNLVSMTEVSVESEAALQEMLARYPQLLNGDQETGTTQTQWVLVAREMGIPSEEYGGDHWAVDHLFLDREAIPTLVEVKRSTDSRIRREVVW